MKGLFDPVVLLITNSVEETLEYVIVDYYHILCMYTTIILSLGAIPRS